MLLSFHFTRARKTRYFIRKRSPNIWLTYVHHDVQFDNNHQCSDLILLDWFSYFWWFSDILFTDIGLIESWLSPSTSDWNAMFFFSLIELSNEKQNSYIEIHCCCSFPIVVVEIVFNNDILGDHMSIFFLVLQKIVTVHDCISQ